MAETIQCEPANTSTTAHVIRERPKLTIPEQISYMRDVKGIKFNIVNEESAAHFLSSNNYYFKLKAFAKNYSKCNSGPEKGKYYDLDFAYLQELSTLDMYLRKAILNMSLNIEHFLKVRLLRDIAKDDSEDGYQIVKTFFSWDPNVEDKIKAKTKHSYCEGLIENYQDHFPVWVLVEVLSFGDLISFCDCYYSQHPTPDIQIGSLKIVKFLRNACAHSNCLINNLSDTSGKTFSQNRPANTFVSSIDGISEKTRSKKMGNRTIHDFVVMLCCFDSIVTSPGIKKHTYCELQELLNNRFTYHKEYFKNNLLLCSNYDFVKKVVDKMAQSCI